MSFAFTDSKGISGTWDPLPEMIRDYWESQPCNIKHAPIELLDTDPLEYSRRVTQRRYTVEPHIRRFMNPNGHILDLGCGIGTDAITMARFGASVIAADTSAAALDVLRTRLHAQGGELLDVTPVHLKPTPLDDMLGRVRLPFGDATFDQVWCFGVLHHVAHPTQLLSEIRRVLKPTGELRLMVYHRCSLRTLEILVHSLVRHPGRTFMELRYGNIDQVVAHSSEAQPDCPRARTYSARSITDLLTRQGFTVTRARYDHVFPYSISRYRQGVLVRRRGFRVLDRLGLMPLVRHRWGWHVLVRAKVG